MYYRTSQEASNEVKRWNKLYPESPVESFPVTWKARVWKFWVGTKKSFENELVIYKRRTEKRLNKSKSK